MPRAANAARTTSLAYPVPSLRDHGLAWSSTAISSTRRGAGVCALMTWPTASNAAAATDEPVRKTMAKSATARALNVTPSGDEAIGGHPEYEYRHHGAQLGPVTLSLASAAGQGFAHESSSG